MGNSQKAVHYSGKCSLQEEQRLEKRAMRPAMAAGQEITTGESWTLNQISPFLSNQTQAHFYSRGTRDFQVVVMENVLEKCIMGEKGRLKGCHCSLMLKHKHRHKFNDRYYKNKTVKHTENK